MSNVLTTIPTNLTSNSVATANNMIGNNNNQFNAPVGAVNTNLIQIISDTTQTMNLSTEYCNIFVVKDESFSGNAGSFNIPKCRVLEKNTSYEVRSKFELLNEMAIAEIKTFPSLFMNTNHDYRRCANQDQMFYYGIVTDIKEQGKCLKIHFYKLSIQTLFQQQLNDNSIQLGININNGHDILDETGWFIKKLDLRRSLMSVGIYF